MWTVCAGGQGEAESSTGKQEEEEACRAVDVQLPGESQRPAKVPPVEKRGVRGGAGTGRGGWIISSAGSLVRMSEEDGAVPLSDARLICGA